MNEEQVETTEVNADVEKVEAPSVSELELQIAKLEESKSRILEESKAYKNKYQATRDELSNTTRAKLEAEGNKEELLRIERERVSVLEKRNKGMKQDILREKLVSEVTRVAKDAHDVDMILSCSEYENLLQIDEDSLEVKGVEDFVSKVRENKSFLFNKSKLATTEVNSPEYNDTLALTRDQKYHLELSKCKSQWDLEKVMTKYGRGTNS